MRFVSIFKKFYWALSLLGRLAFLGCGRFVRNTGQFENIVRAFEADSALTKYPVYVNFIEIKFASLSSRTLAVCNLGMDVPTISVNQALWGNLTDDQKKLVLYHELGHCVLKKGHENQVGPSSSRRKMLSIMDAHPLDLTDFEQYKLEYLEELFNPRDGVAI